MMPICLIFSLKTREIPKPDFHLGVGSSNHGKQTGEMLEKIEEILVQENPDYLLVYGDTNSTLAGALAASKLHIPVIHIEAGLRSFNKKMPEEINRIMTDHVSNLLFCPTKTAVQNLENENILENVFNVGDVMYDAVDYNLKLAEDKSEILEKEKLTSKEYYLITVHRAENTDDHAKMKNVIKAFTRIKGDKVWPIHPRTRKVIENQGFDLKEVSGLHVIDPVGYLDMITLEQNARKIITDSGGVQKEAYFMRIPCITMREQTEWVETLEGNANILVGTDPEKIVSAVEKDVNPIYKDLFGDGKASVHISDMIR